VTQKHNNNQRLTFGSAALRVALGSALSGLCACNGCGSEKPYTPFGVASSLPSAPPIANETAEVGSAGAAALEHSAGYAARKAELVPGAPEAWQGAGLDLKAPSTRRFAQVLVGDFDGDQKVDALAWLIPAPREKNGPPGELWYFGSGAPARKLSSLPGFVPSGPDCTLSTTLTQTGPGSATLDVSATCKAALIARAPVRAIVVVAPKVEQPVLLTLRAASAAPNETLEFSVDSSDQDQDGRDDVRLTLSVTGPGAGEAALADLAWLDRAAGVSRSASEPLASLSRFVARLGSRAHLKHGTYRPESNANALRLLSSLCAESGVARVFDEDGSAFRCGDLTHVVDSLAGSEASYALTQGDVLQAFSVLRRDGWYFRALSGIARKAIERELSHAVSKLDLDPPFVARAQPTLPLLPHYSPLWFEEGGALLIRGANGVTRVTANRSAEEAASGDGGVTAWPLELAAANGERVTGTSHACDRSELLFNISDAQRGLLPPLTTPLLAARPASCSGHGTGPAVSLAPLGFDDLGLDALINGAHVTSAASGQKQPAPLPSLGTPRSPDGHWLITPTALGLLLVGDHKELWQTSALREHADASKLSDCVVANEARAVACIEAGRVLVFERGKPSASTIPLKK
jgi:hypothetical protein